MPIAVPRYLVPFHPKRIPHHFVDVLVIGGGIAGLRAAMEIDPRLSLLVITKDTMEESNSNYAQGGIAGVIDPEDRFEDHVADTMAAGANLCDREVVEMVVREAPEHIKQLVAWGTHFDTEGGPTAARARRWPQPSSHRPCARRRDRPRSDAGHDPPGQDGAWRAVLAEDIHDRSSDARRRLPRGAGLESQTWQDVCLGQADDSLHGRRRTNLSRDDKSSGGHRRWSRARLSRRR